MGTRRVSGRRVRWAVRAREAAEDKKTFCPALEGPASAVLSAVSWTSWWRTSRSAEGWSQLSREPEMAPLVTWSHEAAFAPRAVSVARARDFTTQHLAQHHLLYLVEDVRLVVSELDRWTASGVYATAAIEPNTVRVACAPAPSAGAMRPSSDVQVETRYGLCPKRRRLRLKALCAWTSPAPASRRAAPGGAHAVRNPAYHRA
jgi:hypothetical protein